jgi:hypothetical protein
LCELELGGPATRRFLATVAGSAALFFGVEAVGGGGGLRRGFGGCGLLENVGFVLGESLLETLEFVVEVLDETLLAFEEIEQLFGGKPTCLEVLSRFTRVHTVVLQKCPDLPRGAG